jgi:DNA-binding transcriptional LysR family regulator
MRFRNYDNLRSFIVVARHLNMGTAAGELNLSKGAVSYQVRQLEAELGFSVFSRHRRNLDLTERGRELLHTAQAAFDALEQDISRLSERDKRRITIGMATYFASRWLSPRLMHFISAYPEIALRIQPLVDLMDLTANDLDIAVRWGKGEWQDRGMTVELIFSSPTMLTASARTGEEIESRGIKKVIEGQTLLHDRDDSPAWSDWFAHAGLEWSPGSENLVIPDPNVRVQAVMDGQGVALYDFLVDDEVAAGRLFQYADVSLGDYGYYLVYPDAAESDSAVRIFRDWIMQQAVSVR